MKVEEKQPKEKDFHFGFLQIYILFFDFLIDQITKGLYHKGGMVAGKQPPSGPR